MLETRTRFKEDCDTPRIPFWRSALGVGNQDSLQRGLRHHASPFSDSRAGSRTLETRTRFKEDCDCCVSRIIIFPSFPLKLETRTRFKEDCDNADVAMWVFELSLCWLETRTRFKEDCDYPLPLRVGDDVLFKLETRTRFKEDCDPRRHPRWHHGVLFL